MCIIILDVRKNKQTLEKGIFERSFELNPHGMGIMWAEGGKLETWTSLDDVETLYNIYEDCRKDKLRVAVHFRLGTKGSDNIVENCHPFEIVPGQFAFMHNGTMDELTAFLDDKQSDSQFINKEVLQHFPNDFLSRPVFVKMLNELVGPGRVLFMDSQGKYKILNEFRWGAEWRFGPIDQGVWFSKGEKLKYIIDKEKLQPTTSIYTSPGYASRGYGGAGWYDDPNLWGEEVEPEPKKPEPIASTLGYKQPDNAFTSSLLFLYGFDRADVYGLPTKLSGIVTLGPGVLKGAELWQVREDSDEYFVDPALMLTPSRQELHVRGTIYRINEPTRKWDILKKLDAGHNYTPGYPAKSAYDRRIVEVVPLYGGTSTLKMYCWTYITNPEAFKDRWERAVPNGDWKKWLDLGNGVNEGAVDRGAKPESGLVVTDTTRLLPTAKPVEVKPKGIKGAKKSESTKTKAGATIVMYDKGKQVPSRLTVPFGGHTIIYNATHEKPGNYQCPFCTSRQTHMFQTVSSLKDVIGKLIWCGECDSEFPHPQQH